MKIWEMRVRKALAYPSKKPLPDSLVQYFESIEVRLGNLGVELRSRQATVVALAVYELVNSTINNEGEKTDETR